MALPSIRIGSRGLDAPVGAASGAVQHDRVLLDDLFEDVPDHGRAGFDFPSSRP